MFEFAQAFNRDLTTWDVSRVENMGGMFFRARSLNGNVSNWDTSLVTDMSDMFFEAHNFDRPRWPPSVLFATSATLSGHGRVVVCAARRAELNFARRRSRRDRGVVRQRQGDSLGEK